MNINRLSFVSLSRLTYPYFSKRSITPVRQGVALVEEYDARGTEPPITSASGFLFNAKLGFVLTNEHVIAEGVKHVVKFPFSYHGNKGFPCEVITSGGQMFRHYHRSDWALLKLRDYVPGVKSLPLPTSQSQNLEDFLLLDEVITLGYPATAFETVAFRPALGMGKWRECTERKIKSKT